MSSEEKNTELNDSNFERRIQSARERKRKSHERNKKAQKKLIYFLQELIFSFQTESRAKNAKLQVVLKHVGEVYEEHQKSYGKLHQHISHLSKRIGV